MENFLLILFKKKIENWYRRKLIKKDFKKHMKGLFHREINKFEIL